MSHTKWLIKAKSDLGSAKLLLKGNFFDTAIYHTQQSAEKSLKSFLVFKKKSIPKTHDLMLVLEICENLNKSFRFLKDDTKFLNPFSTSFRYPDSFFFMDPTKDLVEEAILISEKILNFVQETIKELETGQKNFLK